MDRAHPLSYKKKFLVAIFCVILAAGFFVLKTQIVSAQINTELDEFQQQTSLGDKDIKTIIGDIVQVVLGFLGIIAICLVLYGGFIWMTAAGNPDQIDKAKKILINAGIGLVIIMSAYSITYFVLKSLNDATGANLFGSGSGGTGGSGISFKTSGALGTVLESHYPDRGDKNIPRNTPIVITFKMPIDKNSIIDGETINTNAIQIYPISGPDAQKTLDEKTIKNVTVTVAPDNKTFIFKPANYLGLSTEDVQYTVRLTNEILNTNGKTIFSLANPDYDWVFEVSTQVDSEPPHVVSTFPKIGTTKELPRNIGIQITFNEPILPLAVVGKVTEGFNNIIVGESKENALTAVKGTFRITNGYKTIEYIADDPENSCGKNSCGNEVYCLPGPAAIQVLAKAATLNNPATGEPAAAINLLSYPNTAGYNGVVDMVGNSLDGNEDDTSSGPDQDNFLYSFSTSGNKDISAPKIINILPKVNATKIDVELDPVITFSKPMQYSSFSDAMLLNNPEEIAVGFSKRFDEEVIPEGEPHADFYDERGQFIIHHGTEFYEDGEYIPHLPSSIMDMANNCFYPAQDDMGCSGTSESKPWCCNGNPSSSACNPTAK